MDEVNEKIDIANKAYLFWKNTSSEYKKDLFLKLADALEKDIDECSKLETIEM
ncbi:MAG: aldehyde dehydrogenase family protein [Patescibacteria group bacterium]|nr:aldehyde dehydrogenase family protein [Patescibacteria group bacterium]